MSPEPRLPSPASPVIQAWLSRAHEFAGIGTYVISLPTRTVHLSAEFARLLRAGDTALDLPIDEYRDRFLHPDDRAAIQLDAERAYASGEAWSAESRLIRGDGRVIWVRASSTIERTPLGESIVVGVIQDITEIRTSHANLLESEERFHQIATIVREVFWLMDLGQQRYLYVSPAYEAVWGRPVQRLHDEPASWWDAVHADDRERMQHVASRLPEPYDEIYRIVRPDAGEVRWIRERVAPVHSASGAPTRIVGTSEDVTERLALEERVRQAQTLEAVGLLAGGVAHDFNNILAVIMMDAGVAASIDDLAEVRELLSEITTAAERATSLTRQLLAFSRRQSMRKRRLDVNAELSRIARTLHRVMGDAIEVQLRLEAGPLVVQADPGMFEQVLLNLATNARDAMPGIGRLVIETCAVTADEENLARGVVPAGRYVRLRVSDTGCGMPAERLPRLFDPFFTTKDTGQGTGLGLATVFGIVKQHGGWITAQSTVGEGTTFTILLPAVATDSPVAEPQNRTAHAVGGETVLLVEDEVAVRRLARRVLEQAGYHVVEAENGAEGLRAWESHESRIDIVLTDMMMPGGMSGADLAAELRQRCPDLPVIFATGYGAHPSAAEPQALEQQHVLQKPYEPRELLAMIRHGLDHRPNP